MFTSTFLPYFVHPLRQPEGVYPHLSCCACPSPHGPRLPSRFQVVSRIARSDGRRLCASAKKDPERLARFFLEPCARNPVQAVILKNAANFSVVGPTVNVQGDDFVGPVRFGILGNNTSDGEITCSYSAGAWLGTSPGANQNDELVGARQLGTLWGRRKRALGRGEGRMPAGKPTRMKVAAGCTVCMAPCP